MDPSHTGRITKGIQASGDLEIRSSGDWNQEGIDGSLARWPDFSAWDNSCHFETRRL